MSLTAPIDAIDAGDSPRPDVLQQRRRRRTRLWVRAFGRRLLLRVEPAVADT